MLNRKSLTSSARSVQPSLEILEDRMLLSGFWDLAGPVLQAAGQYAEGQARSAVLTATSDVQAGLKKAGDLSTDRVNFNDNPNFKTFVPLAVDTIKLDNMAAKVNKDLALASFLLSTAEGLGYVKGDAADFLNSQLKDATTQAGYITGDALFADDYMFAALVGLGSGRQNLQQTPAPAPQPQPQPSPSSAVTESITPPPATASQADGVISMSATVNNPTNTSVTVTVSYSASDGTGVSGSDTCNGGTITVPLGVPPSAPGVVGTWTVNVTGQPPQTYTTTWQ